MQAHHNLNKIQSQSYIASMSSNNVTPIIAMAASLYEQLDCQPWYRNMKVRRKIADDGKINQGTTMCATSAESCGIYPYVNWWRQWLSDYLYYSWPNESQVVSALSWLSRGKQLAYRGWVDNWVLAGRLVCETLYSVQTPLLLLLEFQCCACFAEGVKRGITASANWKLLDSLTDD